MPSTPGSLRSERAQTATLGWIRDGRPPQQGRGRLSILVNPLNARRPMRPARGLARPLSPRNQARKDGS